MQVFCFAGKHGLLTEELVMRLAYLPGYEKKFYGSLYQALAAGYEKFPSDDVLEAIWIIYYEGGTTETKVFPMVFGWRLIRAFELPDCTNIMWKQWIFLTADSCRSHF